MSRTLLALLLVCLLTPPAVGEEEATPWLESLAEAKPIAAQDGRLILVYLDPDWTRGATTGGPDSLSDLVLRRVAEQLLVVRLPATIDDPESRAARRRFSLWMDRSGAAVVDATGACFWRDVGYSPDLVLDGLASARAAARVYATRLEALSGRPDRAARLELARLQAEHCLFEEAVRLYAALDGEEALSAADTAAWAYAQRPLSDDERTGHLLDRAIETGTRHPDHVRWRLSRATLHIPLARAEMLQHGRADPAVRTDGEAAVRALLAEVREEGDATAEAAVRLQLLVYVPGYAEHVAQPDWIVRNDPQGPYALDAWVRLMDLAISWNDASAAKGHAEAAIAAHPEDKLLVPWLRDGMLPSLARLVSAPDDPEEDPFLLEVRAEPESPGHGEEFWLRVVVKNRSKRELRAVSVSCHLAGPAKWRTRPRGDVERCEAESEYELQFQLRRSGPDPIHLVVLLQRTSAGEIVTERGTHLRIDATR